MLWKRETFNSKDIICKEHILMTLLLDYGRGNPTQKNEKNNLNFWNSDRKLMDMETY